VVDPLLRRVILGLNHILELLQVCEMLRHVRVQQAVDKDGPNLRM
jgi:hypothetical protein